MDAFLTKSLKKKLLCVVGIKEDKKTIRIGDKVVNKKTIVMHDALKSSLN